MIANSMADLEVFLGRWGVGSKGVGGHGRRHGVSR